MLEKIAKTLTRRPRLVLAAAAVLLVLCIFGSAEDMPPEYTNTLRREIEEVPGVTGAMWLSSTARIQIPRDFLPEDLADMFFSGDATMMIVQYDAPGASEETMEAISQVRRLCNERCFLAGFSVVIKDTKDLVDQDLLHHQGHCRRPPAGRDHGLLHLPLPPVRGGTAQL